MSDDAFTPTDLEELDRIAQEQVRSGVRFLDLVNAFRDLVNNLDGYDFSIYDYDNDVSSRAAIDDILSRSSRELQTKVIESLRDLDARFIVGTVVVQRGSTSSRQGGSTDWFARLPKSPGPELASDIESGNL